MLGASESLSVQDAAGVLVLFTLFRGKLGIRTQMCVVALDVARLMGATSVGTAVVHDVSKGARRGRVMR
jgi:hypothetical protein